MAEPLKNYFGPEVPARIAEMIASSFPAFDREAFLRTALDGFLDLELTPRARQVAGALARHLPEDRGQAIEIVTASLGPEIGERELTGMDSFAYLPMVFFARHNVRASPLSAGWRLRWRGQARPSSYSRGLGPRHCR